MDILLTHKKILNQLNSLDDYMMQALFNTKVVQQKNKMGMKRKSIMTSSKNGI
jgi:hypothetical protein